MHATVHLGDGGIGSLPGRRRAASRPGGAPGLRWSLVATPAPIGTGIPRPQPGRFGLISFWDDRTSATEALAATLFGDDFDGLRLDLEPVRAVGSWPGLTWATGLAAPERRTLSTVSWWHDQAAMDTAVRGHGHHQDAMQGQAEKDFHHQSAFVRFRPVAASGSLSGRNGVSGLAAA